MLVLNTCTTDARVLKEANTLSTSGYDISILALAKEGVPEVEKQDNFTIYRIQPATLFMLLKTSHVTLISFYKRIRFRGKQENADNNKKDPQKGIVSMLMKIGSFLMIPLFLPFKKIKRLIWDALYCHHRKNMYISYWLKAKKLAESLRADIYHAHDLNTLLPAYLAAKKVGAKVVYDSHELFTEIHIWGKYEKIFYEKLERFLIRRIDLVITVNSSIADELQKRYKIDRPKIIINCPLPLNFTKDVSSNDLLRNSAHISTSKKLILYQGGYSLHRGLEELIEAFKYLNDDYALIFMGWGKMQSELEALVNSHRLNNKVAFLPPVPQAVLLNYTSSADLGIIPYKPESLNNYYTLPNKLFEYINANIPVAASDLPELNKVINGYNIGRLFDPYDPKSIARVIDYIMSDKDRYSTMKENTKNAVNVFNWNVEARKLLECYGQLTK